MGELKRQKKGISLIVLVISIIIIIILAGTVIISLNGSDIIGKTKEAKDENNKANIKEYIATLLIDSSLYDGTLVKYLEEKFTGATVIGTLYNEYGIVSGVYHEYVYIIGENSDTIIVINPEDIDEEYEVSIDGNTFIVDKDGNLTISNSLKLFGKDVTGVKGDRITANLTGYAQEIGNRIGSSAITWANDLTSIGFTCVYVDSNTNIAYYMADVAVARILYITYEDYDKVVFQRYTDNEILNTYVDSNVDKLVKELSKKSGEHLEIPATRLDANAVPTGDCILIEDIFENSTDRGRQFNGTNSTYWTSSYSTDKYKVYAMQSSGTPYIATITTSGLNYTVVPLALISLDGQAINHDYVDDTNRYTIDDVSSGIHTPVSGDKIVISNANELKYFSTYVNSGGTTTGVTFELGASINLNPGFTFNNGTITGNGTPEQWTPIGTDANNFNGTFNGKTYEISGVYCNNSGSRVGIFGTVGANGTVKNITIKNSHIVGTGYVGGIAGYNYGLIGACKNYSYVNGTGTNTGGIVGVNSKTIKFCFNMGNVNSTSGYTGGIAGQSSGTDTGSRIVNCINTGNITGTSIVGGIVGSHNIGTIQYLSNYGNITGTNHVGGIIGDHGLINYTVNLNYSSNFGNITATGSSPYAGGLVGYCAAPSAYTYVTKCFNYGNVPQGTGGIVGGARNHVSISSSYYLDTCGGTNIRGGTSATSTQFRDGTVKNAVGYDFVQGANYPILDWINSLPAGFY